MQQSPSSSDFSLDALTSIQHALQTCKASRPMQPISKLDYVIGSSAWLGCFAGTKEDIDNQVRQERTIIAAMAPEDPTMGFKMVGTARLMNYKALEFQTLENADEALTLAQDALSHYPASHQERDQCVMTFAISQLVLFVLSSDVDALDQATVSLREVLSLCSKETTYMLYNLSYIIATTLLWKGLLSCDAHAIEAALVCMHQFLIAPTCYPPGQAKDFIDFLNSILSILASSFRRVIPLFLRLVQLCGRAAELLPALLDNERRPGLQLWDLTCFEGLGPAAAIIILAVDCPDEAIELLEAVRGFFWSPSSRHWPAWRTIFPSFHDVHWRCSDTEDDLLTESTPQRLPYEERTSTQPLMPQPSTSTLGIHLSVMTSLRQSAANGAVVILIAHPSFPEECAAVVIPNITDNAVVVRLPSISYHVVCALASVVKCSNLRSKLQGVSPKGQSEHEVPVERVLKVEPTLSTKDGSATLFSIWRLIARPILRALDMKKTPRCTRPRLHWCPTGIFTFLPLHAAGGRGTWVSDYVISSYTPTLTALLSAQRSWAVLRQAECRPLLVAEGRAKGFPALFGVNEELQRVQRILSSLSPQSLGAGEPDALTRGARVQDVVDAMQDATLVHIACHGVHKADISLRLESGLALRDGILTIKHLSTLNLQKAYFAFLSACDTARDEEISSDQTVHLPAALVFVGFRSVIATMWAMNDEDGPFIARTVYQEFMKAKMLTPAVFPYALDLAVSKLRDMGAPPHRWVPYIHVGA